MPRNVLKTTQAGGSFLNLSGVKHAKRKVSVFPRLLEIGEVTAAGLMRDARLRQQFQQRFGARVLVTAVGIAPVQSHRLLHAGER